MADFALALKRFSMSCNFGNQLEIKSKEAFTSGLKEDNIRDKMLIKDLTWDEMQKQTLALDQVHQDKRQKSGSVNNVFQQRHGGFGHRGNRGNFRGRSRGNPNRGYWNKPRHESYDDHHESCERCLGTDHPSTACPFKFSYCHASRRKGHIKLACRNVKQKAGQRTKSSRGKSQGQAVKQSGKGRINQVAKTSK